MSNPLHHKEFSNRISLCRDAFAKGAIERALILDTFQAIGKIHAEDSSFIGERILLDSEKQDSKYWYYLLETVRAEGMLLKQNSDLLKTILQIGTVFTNSPLILHDDFLIWYLRTIYDIVFHDIKLIDEPEEIRLLFFELTLELLNERYRILLERDGNTGNYGIIVYFILMCRWQFKDRKEEFLQLYDLAKYHLQDYDTDGVMRKSWEEMYQNWSAEPSA